MSWTWKLDIDECFYDDQVIISMNPKKINLYPKPETPVDRIMKLVMLPEKGKSRYDYARYK